MTLILPQEVRFLSHNRHAPCVARVEDMIVVPEFEGGIMYMYPPQHSGSTVRSIVVRKVIESAITHIQGCVMVDKHHIMFVGDYVSATEPNLVVQNLNNGTVVGSAVIAPLVPTSEFEGLTVSPSGKIESRVIICGFMVFRLSLTVLNIQ